MFEKRTSVVLKFYMVFCVAVASLHGWSSPALADDTTPSQELGEDEGKTPAITRLKSSIDELRTQIDHKKMLELTMIYFGATERNQALETYKREADPDQIAKFLSKDALTRLRETLAPRVNRNETIV